MHEMRLSQLLSSQDFAFVKGALSGRQQIFGAEGRGLEIHFWTLAGSPMSVFSIIVKLPTHCTGQMCMAALLACDGDHWDCAKKS
jgi:hypothetical protein